VDKGYFSVLLGEITPNLSALFASQTASDRYVEMTVKGIGSGGTDATIMPRLRLLTVPYAFLAQNSMHATNAAYLVNTNNAQVVSVTGTNIVLAGSVTGASATLAGNVTASAYFGKNLTITNTISAATVTATTSISAPAITATTSISAPAITATTSISAPTITATTGINTPKVTATTSISAPTVTATTINATNLNGFGTIPIGGIIMWSGATPPAGWALCDGSQGTPDLRGRFVLASGAGTGLTARTLGSTPGGKETHVLTTSEMPAHVHNYIANAAGVVLAAAYDTGGTKPDDGLSGGYGYALSATSVQTAGGGAAHNNMPPFFVLAFIMRVD
jgi:microcystin-dependent protein